MGWWLSGTCNQCQAVQAGVASSTRYSRVSPQRGLPCCICSQLAGAWDAPRRCTGMHSLHLPTMPQQMATTWLQHARTPCICSRQSLGTPHEGLPCCRPAGPRKGAPGWRWGPSLGCAGSATRLQRAMSCGWQRWAALLVLRGWQVEADVQAVPTYLPSPIFHACHTR